MDLRRFSLKPLFLSLCLSLLSTSLLADEETDEEEVTPKWGEDKLFVGAALYSDSSYYVGIGGDTMVLPDIYARWGRLFVNDTHLGLDLFAWGRVIWTMGFNYGINNLDIGEASSKSDTFYEGLEDRDAAVEWFGSFTFYSDQGIGKLKYYTDVSGEYGGSRARASWEREIPGTDSYKIMPGIFTTYQSVAYNRHYYGIPTDKARVNRPSYDPRNSGDFGVSLHLGYRFDSGINVSIDSEYSWLEEETKDSPLVDNHYRLQSKLSIGYHFK